MTQNSWCYDCTVGGDARAIAQEDWNFVRSIMSNGDRTLDGILYVQNQSTSPQAGGAINGLAVPSNPGGNTVRIASGAALVNGYAWWNDANVDFDVSGGAANATDLIVLRSTPATGLVRLALVRGPAAGTATVTQTAATWEIAIAEVLLTAGGAFSALTDVRKLALPKGAVIPLDEYNGDGTTNVATFSSIPQLFEQLRVYGIVKNTDGLSTNAEMSMRINGSAAASYSYAKTNNIAGVLTTTNAAADTKFNVLLIASNNAATDVSRFVMEIPSYTNGTYYPGVKSSGWNIIGTGSEIEQMAGHFQVAGAVTSISFSSDTFGVGTVDFAADTQIKLYGVV